MKNNMIFNINVKKTEIVLVTDIVTKKDGAKDHLDVVIMMKLKIKKALINVIEIMSALEIDIVVILGGVKEILSAVLMKK